MKWQKKHDIILNWIDSCKTFEQLQNLIPVVKSQPFDTDVKLRMLNFMSIKVSQITINIYNDALQKLSKSL